MFSPAVFRNFVFLVFFFEPFSPSPLTEVLMALGSPLFMPPASGAFACFYGFASSFHQSRDFPHEDGVMLPVSTFAFVLLSRLVLVLTPAWLASAFFAGDAFPPVLRVPVFFGTRPVLLYEAVRLPSDPQEVLI